MHTTIESAFVAATVEQRIHQAEASRLAREPRRETKADTRRRWWFRRSHTVATITRPLHQGR